MDWLIIAVFKNNKTYLLTFSQICAKASALINNSVYKKILATSLCLYFLCGPSISQADDSAYFYALVTYDHEDIITIDLVVDSGALSANVISLEARYPVNQVEAISLDTASSTCSLFIAQEIDWGNINIICGRPNPGFQGQALIGRLTMKRLSPAASSLDILDTSLLLANDGLGAIIETEKIDLSF